MGKLQGLTDKFKIVNPDGTPTLFFINLLQGRGLGQEDIETVVATLLEKSVVPADPSIVVANGLFADAGPIEISADLQWMLDQISNDWGDILFRGVTGWEALAPGAAGQILSTSGPGADPAWITPSGGGGGAVSLISEVVTSGSAANVQFAAIPATYRDLELRVTGRGNIAAANTSIRFRFNADTGANYDMDGMDYNNTPNLAQIIAGTAGQMGYIAGSTAPANSAEAAVLRIGNYRGTVFHKASTGHGSLKVGTGATQLYASIFANWWRSTAAITQIDVFPNSSTFVDGSVVSLYGIM